jgi:uncharacterized protein (DUF2147 family)
MRNKVVVCEPAAMTRSGVIAATVLALLLPAGVGADSQDAILGTWLTDGGDSKVEITSSASKYAGKIVWLKEPERDGKPARDAHNANAALRDRPILGLEILSGFSYASNGTWAGGTVYAPRRGRSYPAELSVGRDGRLDIKVKDGIFSKTVYWTR